MGLQYLLGLHYFPPQIISPFLLLCIQVLNNFSGYTSRPFYCRFSDKLFLSMDEASHAIVVHIYCNILKTWLYVKSQMLLLWFQELRQQIVNRRIISIAVKIFAMFLCGLQLALRKPALKENGGCHSWHPSENANCLDVTSVLSQNQHAVNGSLHY